MKRAPKMSGKKLRRVLLPGMALFLALALTVTTGMVSSYASLDDFFGRGRRTVTELAATGGWDREYYPQRYENTKESRAAAAAVARRVSDEGIVLLKNNGLLPLSAKTSLSPMGLRYCVPIYGGSGSSAIDMSKDYAVTPKEGLRRAFSTINTTLEEKLEQAASATQELTGNPNVSVAFPRSGERDSAVALPEFNPAVYAGTEASCQGTVGVVFIGRQTGEDRDAYPGGYDDGTPHMLALSAAEREAIAFAKRNCAGVVVVLASSAPMQVAELEDDWGVDAILWVGGAGCSGYESLGDILAGAVVPSGRTPDIYPADFTRDPTFPNLDDDSERFTYANAYTTLVNNLDAEAYDNAPFHEYEEGVYLGYKYYETAYDLGYLTDYHSRVDGVLYPFGYGLSYTRFTQEITAFFDGGDRISLTVRVKNTGKDYAGKDVVQLYYTPPYTQLDQEYDIEKPTAVLAAFEKTGVIPPGGHEEITLTFTKEDMASYCYTRKNMDGTTGCYVLEEGEYVISLRANSHAVLDTRSTEIPATLWYDGAHPRQSEIDAQSELSGTGTLLCYPSRGISGIHAYQAASNRFEQLGAYMTDPAVSGVTVLSRKNWPLTQPTAPRQADRVASDTVKGWLAESDSTKYDFRQDSRLGNSPGSLIYQAAVPVSGAENGLVLADLRGKGYYDPMWSLLLDQLDFDKVEELRLCLFSSAYQTGAVESIGKPESIEHDGPQGLTQPDRSGRNWLNGTCGYPSAPVMAATWNRALMYELGYMVGQEALLVGVNGWYAPGLNLHRSPFGGRSAEYYSEDGLLAGYMGAQVISGAGDAGLYCAIKHLVLVDTEGHRNPHTAVWLTEQALREIYLKPFELALKTARKTIRYIDDETGAVKERTMRAGDCIMTADAAVGAYWSSTSYALLSELVRGEWGFQGFIVSDMNLKSNSNRVDLMLRSGCDTLMSTGGVKANAQDYTSATGVAALRGAVKNLCYTLVNSNLMQGAAPGSVIHYAVSPWRVWLVGSDIVAAAILLSLGGWLLWRGRDERRHPEKYRE